MRTSRSILLALLFLATLSLQAALAESSSSSATPSQATTSPATAPATSFFSAWERRASAIQSQQPKWIVPVVSPYPMLIQVFRADFTRQINPTGVTSWNYGTSRSRIGFAAGAGFQTVATTYRTYNHSLIFTGRFRSGYTHHEVVPPRGAGLSRRTSFLTKTPFKKPTHTPNPQAPQPRQENKVST